ncbi:jhy protein homolog [Rhineura floridana]|uniref:jhy protein homolog n=1 Tax=Rhineura floridana TaxID=261503 RepID=UPI002AC87DA9|nr:jhy protein homolog [Rhineura floridana]
MNTNSPLSQNGLLQPHVHYSFLKTASEGLSQSESDSESLAQEIQYQFELQKRIHRSKELVGQSCEELQKDNLDEDSLEEKCLSGEEDSDGEVTRVPNGSNSGEEKCSSASNKEEIVDRYSELRYNPNWKNNKEAAGFTGLDKSLQEEDEDLPFLSLDSNGSPSQFRFIYRDRQHKKKAKNIPSGFDKELLNSCDQPANVSNGSCRLHDKEQEVVVLCHYNSNPSIHSDSSSTHIEEFKQRPEKDFVEKNKLTLGLITQQNNSYLHLHGKKQSEDYQGQAHQYKRPEMSATDPSQATSLKENSLSGSPLWHQLGALVELRSQQARCHNALEFENTHTNSNSYREVSDLEQDARAPLHHRLHPNPSVAASAANCSGQGSQFSPDPASVVHQHGKQNSMNLLTFARNPLQPSSPQNFLEFHSPCTAEKKKKNQRDPENASGAHRQSPYRCTVSEPQSTASHGKCRNLIGHKSFPDVCNAGLQQPVNGEVWSLKPRQIYTKKIPSSHVSGNSEPSQPSVHNLIRALSPATRLIQAAEQHHREISQLADDHLAVSQFASMFPPIIQRGESDSQLNMESCEESQPVLSRSNSEGYLLQMEKQKEKREKENRKGPRTKGYVKMDIKLGGLGPDYETIKEKSEKIKQQKEYAKQIKEHNMKNITSVWKPQPRSENKSVVSRQKALEYAKTIPKPKLFVSRPTEQEPKDEKNLARTLNGENLPPISSLESLQNRHEKEKQVVAAFKTLHIV